MLFLNFLSFFPNFEESNFFLVSDSLKFLSLEGLYKAVCGQNRNKIYPQLTDHYFTGEYPVELVDQTKDDKVTQLSLLSGKSNN